MKSTYSPAATPAARARCRHSAAAREAEAQRGAPSADRALTTLRSACAIRSRRGRAEGARNDPPRGAGTRRSISTTARCAASTLASAVVQPAPPAPPSRFTATRQDASPSARSVPATSDSARRGDQHARAESPPATSSSWSRSSAAARSCVKPAGSRFQWNTLSPAGGAPAGTTTTAPPVDATHARRRGAGAPLSTGHSVVQSRTGSPVTLSSIACPHCSARLMRGLPRGPNRVEPAPARIAIASTPAAARVRLRMSASRSRRASGARPGSPETRASPGARRAPPAAKPFDSRSTRDASTSCVAKWSSAVLTTVLLCWF